jgi:hypothetical protein
VYGENVSPIGAHRADNAKPESREPKKKDPDISRLKPVVLAR